MDNNFERMFQQLCEHRDRLYDENGERCMTVEKALDIYTDILQQLTDGEKLEFISLAKTINLLDACKEHIGGGTLNE